MNRTVIFINADQVDIEAEKALLKQYENIEFVKDKKVMIKALERKDVQNYIVAFDLENSLCDTIAVRFSELLLFDTSNICLFSKDNIDDSEYIQKRTLGFDPIFQKMSISEVLSELFS